VRSIGLDATAYGTHTMRRTKPTLIYRRTRNLRAVQLLLGLRKQPLYGEKRPLAVIGRAEHRTLND
jgi:hypothetical protein